MSPTKKTKPVVKKAAPKKPVSAPKAVSANDKEKVKVETKPSKTLALLRGMKDLLPREEHYWLGVNHAAEAVAKAYGYRYMATPILEDASLFVRGVGKGTDIVEKEMYMFEDAEGKRIALRPETTASVARAYIEHGMYAVPQPVKVWNVGPVFRHDRPQAGRYRQFHQFNVDSLGERDAVIDAELIAVAYNFMRDLGIQTRVSINSIGSAEDRERYLVELVGYFRTKRHALSEESKKRLLKNPLRIFDSKEPEDVEIVAEAPKIIDWLSDDSRKYFMHVLEYLDEMEIPYLPEPTLVRGLDYYCDTVFEFFVDEETPEGGRPLALGGGGRYDGLVEQLGGRPTPAAGFGLGIERIITAMRKQKEGQAPTPEAEGSVSPLFFAHLGEQSRRRALRLIENMRREGVLVNHALAKGSLKAQLEIANRLNATHAIILGQKEIQDGTVIIRDMASGIQEIIDEKQVAVHAKKILQGKA
jgi:histidyl-tRNA synthetase